MELPVLVVIGQHRNKDLLADGDQVVRLNVSKFSQEI